MQSLGANLVCITPEIPDNSLSTKEKNELTFEVLFDAGNQVAESYGLVFTLSDSLREIYKSFGIDLEEETESFLMPNKNKTRIYRKGAVYSRNI